MSMQKLFPTGTNGADKILYAGVKMPYGIGKDGQGKFTINGTNVYPRSLKANPDAELKEIKGPTGQPISIISPSQTFNISGDGYIEMPSGDVAVDMSKIEKGASVTVDAAILEMLGLSGSSDNDKFRVDSFDVNFANEDVASVSFSFKQYPLIEKDPS